MMLRYTNDKVVLCDKACDSQLFMWDDVVEIVAYKEDLITTDIICLLFTVLDGNCITIHEEYDGFMGVIEKMQKKFSIDPNWYGNIMNPVFERNEIVLFNRS